MMKCSLDDSLVVEEAFDGSLGGFFEGFFHEFHFEDFAVGGKGFVGFFLDFPWDGGLTLL